MKSIVIRQLTLLNFKGIRNLTVDFDTNETNIFGANGSGKTTVFDAFTWLLFGKDSTDRKDFNIKTLDENNRPIERIPHEVTACIEVNGEEINLKKCYNEVWSKKRGSAVETFNGHSVECFYNDVPCSVTEYAKKVDEICEEHVFKLITNPLYFTSQKKDYQRTILFRLAGDVTNDDVLERYPEFADLVAMLSGKTLEELKREVQSKKRKIKNSIYITHAKKVWKSFPDLLRFLPEYMYANDYDGSQSTLRVEPKANGKSVVQQLEDSTSLNVTYTPTPTDAKDVRLHAIAPKVECGRVYLVDGEWNEEFIDEVCGFPTKVHDEYVDLLGYAVNYFTEDDTEIPDDVDALFSI